jgi:pimeloyl-ACP methyl ester carboxylesterase
MYLAFYSETMGLSQITDYLLRVVQPQLQALSGVAKAELIGNKTFAMRVWLDPRRMASLGVSATDVEDVLRRNNYLAGIGNLKDRYFSVDLTATTDVSRVEDFRNLVVLSQGSTLVRLQDVAQVELGAKDYDSTTLFKGIPAIFIGIEQAPGENPLSVAKRVQELMPEIRSQLPMGLEVLEDYERHHARLDILAACRRLRAPVLALHGSADEAVEPAALERIAAALPGDAGSRTRRVEGQGHTLGAVHPLTEVPSALRQAIDESVAWLSVHLGAEAPH